MQDTQVNKPQSLNMDVSPKYLKDTEAAFLLNQEVDSDGATGKSTPLPANIPACEMDMPQGENYNVGTYYCEETNESYSWTWNANGVNFISRINGDGVCEVVYDGECLPLSAEPQHKIEQWRAYLRVEELCSNRHGKELIWTDGLNPIGCIDVEASIVTKSFATPFFDRCGDPCSYTQLCVPKPCGCLHAEWIELDPTQEGLSNHMLDTGFMFAYNHVYYDNRQSDVSDYSTLYFQDTKGCFDGGEGLSRCLNLRVPVGNPLVDRINIFYSKDGGKTWLLYDTVEKYKKYNTSQEFWYQRGLAELTNYSDEDCSFDYVFCNDKQCQQVDIKEFSRVYNPIPREAQGLLVINDALAFYNFKTGNCPVDRAEAQKIDISVDCDDTECVDQYAIVTVRAIIHNTTHDRNQFIYRMGGDIDNAPDDTADPAFFGGLNPSLDGGFENGYDQMFNAQTRNFIVYAEGSDNWSVMKQGQADAFFRNPEPWGTVSNMEKATTKNRWRRFARQGGFFYQEAKLKFKKGTKGFLRLASHKATANQQNTSTFVIGILNNIHQYKGHGLSDFNPNTEEIYFDTCNGDVEIEQAFLIQDNAVDQGLAKKASAYYGYIQDKNGRPIHGAVVVPYDGNNELNNLASVTDHNGFFHTYIAPGTNLLNTSPLYALLIDGEPDVDFRIKVEQSTTGDFTSIKTFGIGGQSGTSTQGNQVIEDENYQKDYFANVRMMVKDCNGVGVSGIRVAISGGKYDVTNAGGVAEFRIRNYPNRNRVLRTIVLDNKGCFTLNCAGECSPCMASSTLPAPSHFQGTPVINMASATINRDSSLANRKGLKSGGRYPFGFVVEWPCGKISAVNEIKYIDIPSTQSKNKLSFCNLKYNATGMNLPVDAACLKIVRGENVNPFELQWVVDKIETTSEGKLKLTIQSLHDYNFQYNFKTNTVYQYLKGDRIEFIRNGDGKIFDTSTTGLLNFQALSPFADQNIVGEEEQPADFFNQILIENDSKLDGLTEGAVIEIKRSRECTTEPVYHSICVTIPVENGQLVYPEGSFETFDTYFVQRKIGNFPVQTFEHHSPSDFWGERLTDAGKGYFVNKYENEERVGRNISIASPVVFNYFGDLVKTMEGKGDDIVAMHLVHNRLILAICENGNFLAQVADDLVRVGNDGTMRALAADSIIGDAEQGSGGEYGCHYEDIGSILFDDKFATWADRKHSYIFHDYQSGRIAGEVEGRSTCNSYFKRRFRDIANHNKPFRNALDKYRYSTGKNMDNDTRYLTIKTLRQEGVNTEHTAFLKGNETISFNPIFNEFRGFVSFTPEAYSYVNYLGDRGITFISYWQGLPYIHGSLAIDFNRFYSFGCDRVVTYAINKNPKKKKIAMAVEIQSNLMYFSPRVTVEGDTNFDSEIPPIRVKNKGNKWNAAFLANKNSTGGLYGTQKARGHYILVTLVRDNTDGLQYNTINKGKQLMYDELDLIISKFVASEQSGFEQNI